MTDSDELAGTPSRNLDREETAHDTGTSEPWTLLYRLGRFLVDHFLHIIALIVILSLVLAVWLEIEVPRNVRTIAIAGAIVIPFFGKPLSRRVVSWLWDPSLIWVVDVDARQLDGAVYYIPAQQFRNWDVTTGALDWATPNLAFGKNVSLEEQTIDGVWRGTMSDRQLLRGLEYVKECRGRLEEDAKRGFKLDTHAHGIIHRATRQVTKRLVSTFERGSLPDEGQGLTDEIDAVLEEFDIERQIRKVENEQGPTADVPGASDHESREHLEDDLADLAEADPSSNGGVASDD